MTEAQFDELRARKGLVATCVLGGQVEADFALAREEMRAWMTAQGFSNISWEVFHCVLVENGRDMAAARALELGCDYLLQIDADAAPFAPDSLVRLLDDIYFKLPDADAVGAYCQLKEPPHFPTIDTGSGTWETHFPGEGILPVIRTGGHFLLTKTSAYRRFPAPWHRTRMQSRSTDLLRDFDTFCRTTLGGWNPWAAESEWKRLVDKAAEEAASLPGPKPVGEDSGFCDNLLFHGGQLYVDTDVVVGHITRVQIQPQDLRNQIAHREHRIRLACGIKE